jgi:hypothetical protein
VLGSACFAAPALPGAWGVRAHCAGSPSASGKGLLPWSNCAALFGLVAKLLALGVSCHLEWTCPGPRGIAAQPSIAPGHAWAAVGLGVLFGGSETAHMRLEAVRGRWRRLWEEP